MDGDNMNAGKATVLVVDDEDLVCRLLCDEFSATGFDCQGTTDPLEAKRLLEQKPDVMISDIRMPDASGLELLAYARREAPDCRVILITGNSQQAYVSQALLLGAFDYIEKPLDLEELVRMVREAIAEGRPRLPERAAEAMELSSQARQASLDSVRALVRAVEAKDPYTRRHSEQVAHYATNIGQGLGLQGQDLESLRVASLLHDVGKIGVPDQILRKPGSLTDEEFQHIRRHPALGAEILASITMFGREAFLVRHHHERWDGKGYPDGLVGEESPLAARIIQVADCIDAMLMERTYKKGYAPEKMIGELTRCAGTQFDPQLAAVAVQWSRDNPDKLILPKPSREPAFV